MGDGADEVRRHGHALERRQRRAVHDLAHLAHPGAALFGQAEAARDVAHRPHAAHAAAFVGLDLLRRRHVPGLRAPDLTGRDVPAPEELAGRPSHADPAGNELGVGHADAAALAHHARDDLDRVEPGQPVHVDGQAGRNEGRVAVPLLKHLAQQADNDPAVQ